MTPTLLAGIIAATILAGAFGYLGFRKDYNATLRRRHINKYRDRLRKLDNIILGLPANYFPKTLKALVYASIANSLEHMAQFSGEKTTANRSNVPNSSCSCSCSCCNSKLTRKRK